jgi:PIN domain nuclease of toxin-antitoxin system
MKLLLDTHVLLWWLDDNRALAEGTKKRIADGSNQVMVSAASIWEIIIKRSLNKLVIPGDFCKLLDPFQALDVTREHAFAVGDLPAHHKDPFDRILIAQCRVEGLVLVTSDKNIKRYDIPVLDA